MPFEQSINGEQFNATDIKCIKLHSHCWLPRMDDTAKGGLTQFCELLTVTLCAPKDFKRE